MDDPDRQYTDAVKSALIDAMLDHSLAMDLGPEEWLTVAARQSEGPLAPNQLFDVATIVLRVKGSDLARSTWPIKHQARRGSAEGRRQGLLIYNSRDEGARRARSSRCAAASGSLAGIPAAARRSTSSRSFRSPTPSGGWYDAGIKDGKNKLTPSVTFRVKKLIDDPIRPLSLNLAFKKITPSGEEDFDDFYVQTRARSATATRARR